MKPGRQVTIRPLRFSVSEGVFHPGFFFSSRFLKDELLKNPLTHKTLLDVGSGSGILSIFAAHNGAEVTAIDISALATANTATNAELNKLTVKVIQSDLWDALTAKPFDYIVINPPYYPQQPQEVSQYAWFCGKNFEYFNKLFEGIRNYMHSTTIVLMVLSEDCQIDKIHEIARKFSFQMKLQHSRKNFWETNYIFEIQPIT